MTKEIKIGNVKIGNGNKIAIQSMTNTKTADIGDTVAQINRLANAGCDIIRVAVPNEKDALAIKEIKRQIKLPVIADIHFDYKLAILSIENGADKIRINPGNIGNLENLKSVVKCANEYNVPIRIGVNAGSLEKEISAKYGSTSKALVKSAVKNIKLLEDFNFNNIVVSVKSSDVLDTVVSYRDLSRLVNYPLHIGVTEAGTYKQGIVKSSIGIGALLLDGIGDTIRVSLTGDPVKEVIAAKEILRSVKKDKNYCEIISCPTCGRCEIDLENIVKRVSDLTKDINKPLKIAVMGCVVNGPGEALSSDLGLAGGKDKAVIFKKGKIIKTVNSDILLDEFIKELNLLLEEN